MSNSKKHIDQAFRDIGKFAGDAAQAVGKAAGDAAQSAGKAAGNVGNFIGKTAGNVGDFIGEKAGDVGAAANEARKALDVNGDGVVDITDIIIMAMKTPWVRVDRQAFLRNELKRNHPEEVVAKAIDSTPMQAGISEEEINKIADSVIAYDRNRVSGISAVLGAPGGAVMAATIPADILQYYGYTLHTAQELMYLYGFPEITVDSNDVNIDRATMNQLILCLGTMFGVANASNAIKAMAKMLGSGVQKQLMKKALTKGVIYPIVKQVAKWFGIKMTKEVFTNFFKKAIPAVGSVVGGAITFASFGPSCDRLAKVLQDTALSNPNYKADPEVEKIYTEFTEENDTEDSSDEEKNR